MAALRISPVYTPARLVLVSDPVRSVLPVLALMALASCQSSAGADFGGDLTDDEDGDGGAPTVPGDRNSYCTQNSQCALAASACCGCPSYAANTTDPAVEACGGVMCPAQPECTDSVRAACDLAKDKGHRAITSR